MDKLIKKKKNTFAMIAVRSLAISASTLALFDFLKGHYQAGGLLALGWLTIIIGENSMFNEGKSDEDTLENR